MWARKYTISDFSVKFCCECLGKWGTIAAQPIDFNNLPGSIVIIVHENSKRLLLGVLRIPCRHAWGRGNRLDALLFEQGIHSLFFPFTAMPQLAFQEEDLLR